MRQPVVPSPAMQKVTLGSDGPEVSVLDYGLMSLSAAYGESDDETGLRAIQTAVDDGIAKPIIIGRRKVVDMRIKKLRLRLEEGKDYELCDPEKDSRYRDYWATYHELLERRGVTPAYAKTLVRTDTTVIGALMLHKGDADAVICGAYGRFKDHLKHVYDIIFEFLVSIAF